MTGRNLNEMYENELKKNRKSSYAEYLIKNGERSDEIYHDERIKASNSLSAKDTDYGVTASRLFEKGLNASGYEDYLKHENASAYQKALSDAEYGRQYASFKNESGYERYLSDYEALQTKAVNAIIEKYSSGTDFNIEHAFADAVKAGISRERAYYTAATSVRRAKENTVQNAVTFAKLNGLSAKQAKEYAKELGLDERYASLVYDKISNLSDVEKDYFSSLTADGYYDYIISQANKK